MYYCRSRKLRPKTMNSYEQTLCLFERWLRESEGVEDVRKVTEATVRRYIVDLQQRGKYTVCVRDRSKEYNYPERRRDYRSQVSDVTINNYIRNLRAAASVFGYLKRPISPLADSSQIFSLRPLPSDAPSYSCQSLKSLYEKLVIFLPRYQSDSNAQRLPQLAFCLYPHFFLRLSDIY